MSTAPAPASNLVTITIDGQVTQVPKGMILVDAAKTIGVDIPIFCYHSKMRPVGACRMCMVQIAPANRLTTACTTPVADGMVVTTNSDLVRQGRTSVLEFLLLNHPLDCPVCDKGGECPLQDNTFAYGPSVSRYIDQKQRYEKPIDLSPLIKLDRERCILCYRCTRFATEIAGDESLTVLDRGTHSEIGLAEGRSFDSPFSGNTIELCPVGALTSSLYRFRARPWDINSTASVCPHCSVGCNITVQTRKTADQVVRLLARENTPVDDGWLCDYGRFNYDYINAEDRLKQPMVRYHGELMAVDWETALDAAAEQLSEVVRRQGPGALGGIASPQLTNEELYLFQKLMRGTLGTGNVDYRVDGAGYVAPFQYDASTGSIAALERAGAILLVGASLIEEAPVLDLRVKKAVGRGVPLIVIHSEPVSLTRQARLWVQPHPGTEAMVLAAMLKVIITENERIEGFALSNAEAEALNAMSLDDLAQATGVSTDRLAQAARLYAAAGPHRGAIIYRRDDTALPGGEGMIDVLLTLAMATGTSGDQGLGLYGLVRDGNEQGALDMGLVPTHLPGHRRLDDKTARAELAALWGSELPTSGLSGAEMLAAAGSRVHGLYLIGATPRGLAQANRTFQTALAKLDCLIVQDIGLTDLVRSRATVVLPGATFIEKEGTITNLERRVQRLRIGLQSPGTARADWRILRDLGARLAGKEAFGHITPRETMAEIVQATPIYAGITYGRLGQAGLQWPTGLTPETASRTLVAAGAAPQG